MKEIELTNGGVTIIEDEDYEWLNQWNWYHNEHGYVMRKIKKNGKQGSLFMHRLILNTPNNMISDHINHDKLDNRRCNLRICTSSQNGINASIHKNNTSGFRGVSFDKINNKWRASIVYHRRAINLGRFDDIDDAVKTYNIKAKELYGEFALIPSES